MDSLRDYIETRNIIESYEQPIEDYLTEHGYEPGNSEAFDRKFLYLTPVDYREYLYESLLYSYSLDNFVKKFSKIFPVSTYHIDRSVVYIRTTNEFSRDDEQLISLMNLYNVFFVKSEPRIGCIVDVSFEQRKPENVMKQVSEYDYAYHLATKERVEKILKYGLQPKSHSKKSYHPERVYLLLPTSTLNIESMKRQLKADVVLKIDLKKMREHNQKYDFYRDGMTESKELVSVFTENTIYPEVISRVS